jgi:hypothetical protein
MEFSNGRIKFKRGDDDAMMVALKKGAIFQQGDKVFFSLKQNASDKVDIFQVESTTFVPYADPDEGNQLVEDAAVLITIDHELTIGMATGKYFYDILVQWADGTYATLVPPTRFELVPGGSHESL